MYTHSHNTIKKPVFDSRNSTTHDMGRAIQSHVMAHLTVGYNAKNTPLDIKPVGVYYIYVKYNEIISI